MAANTSAVQFVSASSQVVTVTNPTALNGLSKLTIVFYLRPTTMAGSKGIISRINSSGTNNQFTIAADGADNTQIDMAISSTTSGFFDNFAKSTTGQLALNTYKQYAWVFDGTLSGNTNRLKLYVNAVQDTGLTFSGTIPAALMTVTKNLVFGQREDSTNFLDGMIDEPLFINDALTAGQIAALDGADNTAVANGILYWKFNDNTGTTATAAIGGINGTLTNSNQWTTTVPFANYLTTGGSGILMSAEI